MTQLSPCNVFHIPLDVTQSSSCNPEGTWWLFTVYINLSSINFYHFSFYWGALSFLIILGCLILLLQPSDFFFVQIFSSFTLNVQQWNKLSFNPLIHYTVIYQCCVSLSHSVFLSFYYWTLDFKGLLS